MNSLKLTNDFLLQLLLLLLCACALLHGMISQCFISYLRYFALRLTKPNLNLPCALACVVAKPNLDFF